MDRFPYPGDSIQENGVVPCRSRWEIQIQQGEALLLSTVSLVNQQSLNGCIFQLLSTMYVEG